MILFITKRYFEQEAICPSITDMMCYVCLHHNHTSCNWECKPARRFSSQEWLNHGPPMLDISNINIFFTLYLILNVLYNSSHSGRAGRRTAQAAASRIRSVVYNAAQISNVGPFVRLLRDKCRYDTLYFSVYILYTYTFVWLLRDKCR